MWREEELGGLSGISAVGAGTETGVGSGGVRYLRVTEIDTQLARLRARKECVLSTCWSCARSSMMWGSSMVGGERLRRMRRIRS